MISDLLATSALHEGKHVQSFPEFGPIRMGAPLMSFTRINEKSIDLHCRVYEPDIVMVLDLTLLKGVNVFSGVKESGIVMINSEKNSNEIRRQLNKKYVNIITLDASKIALEIFGRPIVNTIMLGALARVTKIIKLENTIQATMEYLDQKKHFQKELIEKNIKAITKGYQMVLIK